METHHRWLLGGGPLNMAKVLLEVSEKNSYWTAGLTVKWPRYIFGGTPSMLPITLPWVPMQQAIPAPSPRPLPQQHSTSSGKQTSQNSLLNTPTGGSKASSPFALMPARPRSLRLIPFAKLHYVTLGWTDLEPWSNMLLKSKKTVFNFSKLFLMPLYTK